MVIYGIRIYAFMFYKLSFKSPNKQLYGQWMGWGRGAVNEPLTDSSFSNAINRTERKDFFFNRLHAHGLIWLLGGPTANRMVVNIVLLSIIRSESGLIMMIMVVVVVVLITRPAGCCWNEVWALSLPLTVPGRKSGLTFTELGVVIHAYWIWIGYLGTY